jgi:hypothetical protein
LKLRDKKLSSQTPNIKKQNEIKTHLQNKTVEYNFAKKPISSDLFNKSYSTLDFSEQNN